MTKVRHGNCKKRIRKATYNKLRPFFSKEINAHQSFYQIHKWKAKAGIRIFEKSCDQARGILRPMNQNTGKAWYKLTKRTCHLQMTLLQIFYKTLKTHHLDAFHALSTEIMENKRAKMAPNHTPEVLRRP